MKKITAWKIDYLFLFILMSVYYSWIQWNNFIGDPDGFYHAKLAIWLRQGHFIQSLPWMQFSTLRDSFTDHHLLYHILLAPFTYIPNPLVGVKIATVVFAVLMVMTFYWLLKRMKIIWPIAFALAFLTLNGLNFRISLVKANSLSLLIIWLLIYALFNKKIWLSMLLSWLFVWLYGGWPLAILILITYIVSEKIYTRIHSNRVKIFWDKAIHFFETDSKHKTLKISTALLTGLALGVIINPYWPQNLYFYYQQVIQIGLINQGQNFVVGGEWYGTSIMNIISSAPHVFVLACLSFLTLFFNVKKASRLSWFSFILVFGFMILTIKSRRYVEYYMPFALLFTASSITDLKDFIKLDKVISIWEKLGLNLKIYLSVVAMVFFTMVMPSIYDRILNVKLSDSWTMDKFLPATNWLAENTPPDSIVFHSDWDEWPVLFYHNDHNYYLIGLDPTFMENYNSQLHKTYRDITNGETKFSVAKQIKNYFGANYIFVDKNGHQAFIDNLSRDKDVELMFNDNDSSIYKINL
ncbi:hypothetical protein KKH39_00855 [Patescibacteria group bacterium]|nr:hypothetical protein [Patescibacteria group bacterium]